MHIVCCSSTKMRKCLTVRYALTKKINVRWEKVRTCSYKGFVNIYPRLRYNTNK